jgi:hypothetical protein
MRWLFEVSEHPAVKVAERTFAFLMLFGVVVVFHLHVEALLILLFLIFFFFGVWAKGARLKWLHDRHQLAPLSADASSPHIGEYHAHGPTFVVDREAFPLTPEALDQLARLTPKLPQAEPTRPDDPQAPKGAEGQTDYPSGVAEP